MLIRKCNVETQAQMMYRNQPKTYKMDMRQVRVGRKASQHHRWRTEGS